MVDVRLGRSGGANAGYGGRRDEGEAKGKGKVAEVEKKGGRRKIGREEVEEGEQDEG